MLIGPFNVLRSKVIFKFRSDATDFACQFQFLIMAHIRSEYGFLDMVNMCLRRNKQEIYREDMDSGVFEKCVPSILLRIEPSVIVMDEPYNSRRREKLLTSA